ncbi:hypothetical protein [Olleya sp. YS]|uniref:hypothetical protein n=1 Tax=Olleya sp. YS TaxID=3028318 RepID=UPI00243467B2|nr:hypothetical protein [Olleya sp. YS]WGD35216.1 hypothetical protein Ollyesu_02090 [Olleya sp. YS]
MTFNLHKWLFSITVVALLVSFSGYATTSSEVITPTTEWIKNSNTKDQSNTFYVDFSFEDSPMSSFVFYESKFSTFLLQIKKQNLLRLKTQHVIFNHYKRTYLNRLIKPNYVHHSVSN